MITVSAFKSVPERARGLVRDLRVLFESGAIVLHIGERSEALLPREASARARAIQWVVAALNTIEPFVLNVAMIGSIIGPLTGIVRTRCRDSICSP